MSNNTEQEISDMIGAGTRPEDWEDEELDLDSPINIPPKEEEQLDLPGMEGKKPAEVPEETVPETIDVIDPVLAPVATEAPVAQPSGEMEALKEQNRVLMERLNELMDRVQNPPAAPVQAPAATPTSPTTPIDPLDFIGDEDVDELLATKEGVNKLLSTAMQRMMETSQQAVFQQLPKVVQEQVTQQNTMRQFVDSFYDTNKDLQPVKRTVGFVANEVAAANPNKDLNFVLEETAKRVRSMLGIPTGGVPTPTPAEEPSPKPALPGVQKSGSRTGGGTLTGQQKQIIDLIS